MAKNSSRSGTALAAVLLAVGVLLPVTSSAQASDLDVAQAQEFLGNWNVTLQSDVGPLPVTLNITDVSGKVGAQFGSDQGIQDVQDITRSGDSLVLAFSADAQGMPIDVEINLTRDGDGLRAAISAMDGAFVATGTGARAQ